MSGFFQSLLYHVGHPLLFNSVLFFLLFTLFYGVYILVFQKIPLRNFLLLLFSLYFYYKISGLFVIMLLMMATSDYLLGLWIFYIRSQLLKRILVALSILINVGYLCYFKYTTFLLGIFHFQTHDTSAFVDKILLPIGMSFFVFKTLTYIFDIYREVIEKPEHNYINYVLYVSFFPNILAGPISKARDLLPQLSSQLNITEENISRGLFLILSGAFKKVFLSDFIAVNFVDRVFDSPNLFSGFENLMAGYGALIQLYCDFSGYTDIVIGLALLMGFQLQANFNQPFLSQNITEFWRRWHISLSQWISDYLFYPLSYSFRRLKKFGTSIAVLLTFLISGLWHGPQWTFILWGGAHGVALVWDLWSQNLRSKISKVIPRALYRIISILITFNFLVMANIMFRASDLNTALDIYKLIFNQFNPHVAMEWVIAYKYPFLVMLLALVLHYMPSKLTSKTVEYFTRIHWALKAVIAFVVIIFIYQTVTYDTLPFIYLSF